MFFTIRQNIVLLLFFLLGALVVLSARGLDWNKPQAGQGEVFEESLVSDESYFKDVRAYFLNIEGPRLFLLSDELTVHSDRGEVSFIRPRGIAFTQDEDNVEYQGLRGRYHFNEEKLSLFEKVEIKRGRDWIRSENLVYDRIHDYVDARDTVRTHLYYEEQRDQIYIDADWAFGSPSAGELEYQGHVDGRIQRARAFEPPIYFKSHRLLLTLAEGRAQLFDDVFLKKQEFTATSYTGELYLDNYNKRLKYFVLNDDVKVVEKVMLGRGPLERRAFSERLEGFTSENKIVLTGFPRVFQHQDVIKGNRIILRENSEIIEVEDSHTNFIIGR